MDWAILRTETKSVLPFLKFLQSLRGINLNAQSISYETNTFYLYTIHICIYYGKWNRRAYIEYRRGSKMIPIALVLSRYGNLIDSKWKMMLNYVCFRFSYCIAMCIRIWMFTTTCLVWDEYYNRIFIYVMHDNSQWILAERVGTE